MTGSGTGVGGGGGGGGGGGVGLGVGLGEGAGVGVGDHVGVGLDVGLDVGLAVGRRVASGGAVTVGIGVGVASIPAMRPGAITGPDVTCADDPGGGAAPAAKSVASGTSRSVADATSLNLPLWSANWATRTIPTTPNSRADTSRHRTSRRVPLLTTGCARGAERPLLSEGGR